MQLYDTAKEIPVKDVLRNYVSTQISRHISKSGRIRRRSDKQNYVQVKKKMSYERERREEIRTFKIYLKQTNDKRYYFLMRNFVMLVNKAKETHGFVNLTNDRLKHGVE